MKVNFQVPEKRGDPVPLLKLLSSLKIVSTIDFYNMGKMNAYLHVEGGLSIRHL